jgi:predicted esterase
MRFPPFLAGWLLALSALAAPAAAEPIAVSANPAQKYELFKPDGYPGDKRWPVLIVLDPRGRAESALAMAQAGAAANGWLVLSAYGSRSDDREQLTMDALQALLREAGTRYAYDPKRVYLAGMSGTAKSLWIAERALHGMVAGFIGAGGARPSELGALRLPAPAYFGLAGTKDFNYREMRELDADLARVGATHAFGVFEGAHGWPPPEDFTHAIDWLELQAMRSGLAPKRDAWIDAQLAASRARANSAKSSLERWRAFDQLVRDFDSLRDIGAERAQADTLQASTDVRAQLAAEQELLSEEARFARGLDEWATRLGAVAGESGRLPPPDTGRTLATLRIRSLQKHVQSPDQLEAESAQRRLETAYAAGAHYLADEQQLRGNEEGARAALRFAAAVFPDRPYPTCRLEGLQRGLELAQGVSRCGSSAVRNAR